MVWLRRPEAMDNGAAAGRFKVPSGLAETVVIVLDTSLDIFDDFLDSLFFIIDDRRPKLSQDITLQNTDYLYK